MLKKKSLFLLVILFCLAAGGLVFWGIENHSSSPASVTNQAKKSLKKLNVSVVFSLKDFPQALKYNSRQEAQRIITRLNKEYYYAQKSKNPYPHLIEVGILKKMLGDYQGAEKAWEKAAQVAQKKRPVLAYGNLADLNANYLHNYQEALSYYQKALKLDKTNYNYWSGLASLYFYHFKNPKKGTAIILEAVKEDPAHAAYYYSFLVDYYQEHNNPKLAKYYQEKIKKIKPNWHPYTIIKK